MPSQSSGPATTLGRVVERVIVVADRATELNDVTIAGPEGMEDAEVVTGSTGVAQNHYVRENFHRCIDLYSKMWHHHTEFLMLGYGAYVVFFEFCKQAFPEIPDQMVARMVAGIEVTMYRPGPWLNECQRT